MIDCSIGYLNLPKFFSLILILVVFVGGFGVVAAQPQTETCEQCGMTVDATGQARLVIVDSDGSNHIACCPICALKLLKTYPSLTVTSFCDYRGPDYPITILAANQGKDVTVNPESALIIAGGGCTKNRLVCDAAAADALLSSPNNGTSSWLSPLSNDQVAKNATRLSIYQAAVKFSEVVLDPSECEVCGMTVTADSQWRYNVVDGQGETHYVECYMCALSLINKYETLRIETTCDWFGPGYPVIVESSKYGQTVTVSPSSAVFLRGGSCVTARVAYNQTASDNLLAYGYSSYTSPEQKYVLPTTTQVNTVAQSIQNWYAEPVDAMSSSIYLLVLIIAVGLIIIVISIFVYRKLKTSEEHK